MTKVLSNTVPTLLGVAAKHDVRLTREDALRLVGDIGLDTAGGPYLAPRQTHLDAELARLDSLFRAYLGWEVICADPSQDLILRRPDGKVQVRYTMPEDSTTFVRVLEPGR